METLLKLIEQYKSLTLGKLEYLFTITPNVTGAAILGNLTGFGSFQTCSICKEAVKGTAFNEEELDKMQQVCDSCIYKRFPLIADNDSHYCLDETYRAISHAKTAEELYQALQDRIHKLERIVNENIRERRVATKSE
jgi:hypothetical protein